MDTGDITFKMMTEAIVELRKDRSDLIEEIADFLFSFEEFLLNGNKKKVFGKHLKVAWFSSRDIEA